MTIANKSCLCLDADFGIEYDKILVTPIEANTRLGAKKKYLRFDMDEHLYNVFRTTGKTMSPTIFKENTKQISIKTECIMLQKKNIIKHYSRLFFVFNYQSLCSYKLYNVLLDLPMT